MRATGSAAIRTIAPILIGILLAGSGPTAFAATYTIFDPPGARETDPTSINKDGAIAGYTYQATGGSHGFIRAADGSFVLFDVDGAANTFAAAINDSGWTAGTNSDSHQFEYGFVRDAGGQITVFSPPSGHGISVNGFNRSGEVCGAFVDASRNQHGFVRTLDGTFTAFDAPDGVVQPTGINDSGTVTGWVQDNAGLHGFIRTPDGTLTEFDEPASNNAMALGINASGVIVGTYFDANSNSFGFIRDVAGNFTSFQVGRSSDYYPIIYGASINAKGEVAGYYDYDDEYYRAFFRKPKGKVKTFSPPKGAINPFAVASAINAKGVITGNYYDENYVLHGYVRTP